MSVSERVRIHPAKERDGQPGCAAPALRAWHDDRNAYHDASNCSGLNAYEQAGCC